MSNPENLSFRSLAARFIVDEAVQRFKNSIPPESNLPIPSKGATNPIPKQYTRDPECEGLPVCIIGAGIAGLYTAMMLDSLGKKYEVIEASPRCGGRAFTHHFTKTETFHDYFDLGAMRFPRIKIMDIAFKLFEKLHLDRDGKVIRYIMDSPNNIQLFNGHKVINKGMYLAVDDPFHVGEANGGDIPIDLLEYLYTKHDGNHLQGADALFEAVLAPFKLALIQDPKAGWHKLMHYDALSMRGYLLQNDRKNLPFPGTDWMETMKSSTGTYDLALSETVLDSLDFDYPFGPNNPAGEVETWSCIDGGASIVTDRMCEYINTKPVFNRRVVGIRMQDQNDHKSKMFVKVKGHPEYDSKPYSHVIATPPIPCLRSMDMSGASLSYTQKQALRCLNYGAAIKVGIKFKTRWWQAIRGFEQIGGVSNTDRPSRIVVYPSYGLEDPIDGPGVLIASYAWTQDASRLGSLIQGKGTKAEETLLDIVYEDLAVMHGKTAEWYKDYTLDYYAHDWYHDEYTMGAFAQFGPGQFKYLYPEISRPAARGNLHFAGEATSTHRAWIAGALDSATRAVYHLLLKDGDEDRIKAHLEEWGVPEEIEAGEQAAWQVLRSIYGD